MSEESPRHIELKHARRLAISCQSLDRTPASKRKEQIKVTIRRLGCVQYDPIQVLAPSHQIVLWSRLGAYPLEELDELLWSDRELFEYWAHAASIVLAENFPIHQHQMALFGTGDSSWSKKSRRWLAENRDARQAVIAELKANQPMGVSDFETNVAALWQSQGWSQAQGVKHLLQLMWLNGEVAVAGRRNNRKLFATADHWYKPYSGLAELSLEEAMERAVLVAVGALGVATARHIENYFIRGYYQDLEGTLARLVQAGKLLPASVGADDQPRWFLDSDKVEHLERIEAGQWEGRTTLLSPFDNLTADRERTDQLWGFNARSELYVPKADRVYGHYVLPLLWGDRLAGRVDPTFHSKTGELELEAIFAENWARSEPAIGRDLGQCLQDLAEFLGARRIKLSRRIPRAWHKPLKRSLA